MSLMAKEKAFDLDGFYASRQALAGELNSPYAHRQLSEIRKHVQERKLQAVRADKPKATKTEEK